MKFSKRLVIIFLILTLLFSCNISMISNAASEEPKPFSDVPKTSYAYNAVNRLRSLGITNGYGDNLYGFGKTLTRGEFITFLVRIMNWEQISPSKGSFSDNKDPKKFYYKPIETALAKGVIANDTDKIRPDDNITREEAAIIMVNTLGYKKLAEQISYFNKPFADVTKNIGYITIVKDLGIFNGEGGGFNPNGSLLREQAAAILIRLVDVINNKITDLNAFYAISSSSQHEKIQDLTSICFGWSALSYDESAKSIILNTSRYAHNYNDYYLPTGFTTILDEAKAAGIPAMLMVQSTQTAKMTSPETGSKVGIPEYILKNPKVYNKVINDIVSALKSTTLGSETGSFDGVVIDIEGLKGEELKKCFNDFLKALKSALDKENKKLYVAVQPLINKKRSSSCNDGYDYRTIGELADRVILMAHDYDAKKLTASEMASGYSLTPPTPIEDVYYALEAITDKNSGVADKSKIMLQINFCWNVWHKKDGKIINSMPDHFNLENFMELLNSDTKISYNYSDTYENSYIKYVDESKGTENIIWYENTQSVMKKIELAKLFGIKGISLWRLGNVPDYDGPNKGIKGMDIWQNILNELEKN